MRSEAETVDEYRASLPAERRAAIAAVRETVLARLPEGYVEVMDWGMISYHVLLARYPDTFRRLEDLPLEVIGAAVAGTPVDTYIERYERSPRGGRASSRGAKGSKRSSP